MKPAKGRKGSQEEQTMSRQLIKGMTMLLLVVALAFVSAVVSANAQSSSARADIPFEFAVGSKTLSAGQYNISAANATGDVVKVSGRDTNETAMRLTIGLTNGARADKSKLVFHRYGNRYFLTEVWNAGEKDGRQLMKSKEEKAIERELASIQSKTEFAQGGYERIEIALVRQ